MKKQYLHALFFITVLVGLTFIFLIPLLKSGFIVTDDAQWMVIRLTSFYQSFADGQFPVRYLSRLNHNYGYPVANFLYPGFLYIGSFLRILKIPYTNIIELIMGGSVLISIVFMFFWLKRFFSSLPSFIGACSLLVSPYFLYDVYKRGSVGELLATAVVIVLLWAIESGLYVLIPPITALLLISHNTLALIFSLFLVGYVIIRKKYNTIVPLGIGAWMTSFFWIPAIFERMFVRFDLTQVSNPLDHLKVSQQLVLKNIPFLTPFFLFLLKKKGKYEREFLFFILCVIVCIVGATVIGVALWKISFLIYFIQFPYRLLSILFIAGPWLVAMFVARLRGPKKIWIGSIIIILLFLPNISLLSSVRSELHEEGFYLTNEDTTTVQDEYMPRWVTMKPVVRPDEKLELYSGKGKITPVKNTTKLLSADLTMEEESVVQFNTVYYPGWGAMLDQRPIQVTYQNPKGVMQVTIPKGNHRISFEFRETAFRFAADSMSSIGIILYGVYLLYLLLKNTKRKSRL